MRGATPVHITAGLAHVFGGAFVIMACGVTLSPLSMGLAGGGALMARMVGFGLIMLSHAILQGNDLSDLFLRVEGAAGLVVASLLAAAGAWAGAISIGGLCACGMAAGWRIAIR